MSEKTHPPIERTRITHLEMRDIVKQFPGVLAADHIHFDIRAGEVHALLGENGAGKSTLMKMLYGLYAPDGGEILLNGQPIKIKSPHDAITQGIGMIHQHFMLVPSLTVAENIALGMKSSRGMLTDIDVISEEIRNLSDTYNLKVNPNIPIWQLAVGEQQRVEILRALFRGADLLILDEPTAVLTPQEVNDLFEILKKLCNDGHALIFISHKLHEVLEISHRITVLRDGKTVDTIQNEDATKQILAEMMVGRPVILEYEKAPYREGRAILNVNQVSALSDRGDDGLSQVSFELHEGEILGVAGISGNGQHELAQVIAGLRQVTQGHIAIDSVTIDNRKPSDINALGISYIPEERMLDGVIKEFTVAENLILQDHNKSPFSIGRVFLNFTKIREACVRAIQDYDIKTPSTETPIKNLSGGNIQKLVLARELSRNPRVLIAAQPTRGVDIGASEYIHQRLLEEREKGTAILLISEDLDEIRALSDRIMVMYEGKVVGIVQNEDTTLEQLGLMMTGNRPNT